MADKPPSLRKLEGEVLKIIQKAKAKRKKKMNDKVTAYIRTYAPILVGGLIAWLATFEVVVDSQTQAALVVLLTAIIQGLYYALARLIGSKYPKIERFLLGSSKTPNYEE